MGWKSTIDISREKAKDLIITRLMQDDVSNDELSLTLEDLGYGENTELEYYGHNFCVLDSYSEND